MLLALEDKKVFIVSFSKNLVITLSFGHFEPFEALFDLFWGQGKVQKFLGVYSFTYTVFGL